MTSGSKKSSTPRSFRAGAAVGLTLFAAVLPAQDEATEREAAALVEAALAAARDAASVDDLARARERFLEVPRRFPRSEHPRLQLRGRALVEAAALGRRTGVERQAAGELLRVLEREAGSEWTARAHFELGDLLLMRGDWRNAARHLRLAREGTLGGTGGTGGGGNVAGDALERMTLIHRLILRPLAGQERWLDSRSYLPARAGIERPRGVATGADGRLVVTETNRAAILDAAGAPVSARDLRGAVRPSHAAGRFPGVVTSDGVTGMEDPRTVSFDRIGGGDLDRIVAAHRDDFGNWTVLSRRSAEVLRYDPQGRPLETLRVAALNQPIDLAVGRDGAIHVLDAGARSTPPSVLRFAADGRFEEAFRADWRRPVALAVDAFGNRYVLDAGTLQVLVYDPVATPLAALGPVLPGSQELRTPEDVAVDGQARIFIADSRLGQVLVLE
ncbi:MAG: hypothetical protein F4210_08470 [Holophagales bacterium]|nr:hypothetical protein [Holophagales bacterium]MYF95529.1 hypothetical protein [Holophagales bacterium]